jgi:hypothetical protein
MINSAWHNAPSALTWPLRHPFLVGSIAVHMAMLMALWVVEPSAVQRQRPLPRDEALISASLAQAQRIQLQRRVRAIEQLQRELAGTPAATPPAELPNDPQALLERAKTAAAAIQKTQEQQRAEELAKLLNIPVPKALEKVRAAQPKDGNASRQSAAEQIAQLEQRAQQAAASAAQRAGQAAQGTAVSLGNSGSGEQGASQSGAGSAGGGERGDAMGQFRDPRQYTKRADFDAVARSATRFAVGRTFGQGGQLADRVYLNDWYIAGPFEGRGRDSVATEYPPEWGVDLDAVYAGWDGGPVRWQHMNDPRYPFVPLPKRENAVYYAYAELRVDAAQTVWLDIGADDDSKLWLNDRVVWVSDDGDKPWYHRPFYNLGPEMARYGLVEGTRRVALQPGRNTLLFKLYNGIDLMFFSVVVRP